MNYGPVSQVQLETLRAASSQISNIWDELVEPIKKFGEKYGSAQISECGGFMDRNPENGNLKEARRQYFASGHARHEREERQIR